MMRRDELVRHLDELLGAARFRDYCPNGLQVEGREDVQRLVLGVSASQRLLDVAIARQADAVLVHHGWFWRGEDGRVTGWRRARMKALLAHDLNLIAYHLPLDGHETLGNNVQLARLFGWSVAGRFGEDELGWHGVLDVPVTLSDLSERVAAGLGRTPLVIGDAGRNIRRIAWCSGGAQSLFEQAIALNVDAYLTGEISEQHVHLARESGVAFIAAGHHASERLGVRALGDYLAEQFGLECEFVEIDNPV